MLSIEMLAAERGDAILIEYGEGTEPTNRILIDGGPVNSGLYEGVRQRLLSIEPGDDGLRHFDLLVISHIDADHIEGVIRLLQDNEVGCTFDDIWFNGWKHIESLDPAATVESLGAAQGEFLGALLAKQERPWNEYFTGSAVVIPDEEGPLPEIELRGGMKLTLLSPTIKRLEVLATEWERQVATLGFEPGDAEQALAQLEDKWWAAPAVTLGDDDRIRASADKSAANGSSIAFIASWQDRSLLLAADAFADVLTASLRRVRTASPTRDKRVPIDAFKLSHHGSENNITTQLMNELSADAYMVSSNGNRFSHPNAMAIRTVLDGHSGPQDPIICFNYRQEQTELWDDTQGIDARFEEAAVLRYD